MTLQNSSPTWTMSCVTFGCERLPMATIVTYQKAAVKESSDAMHAKQSFQLCICCTRRVDFWCMSRACELMSACTKKSLTCPPPRLPYCLPNFVCACLTGLQTSIRVLRPRSPPSHMSVRVCAAGDGLQGGIGAPPRFPSHAFPLCMTELWHFAPPTPPLPPSPPMSVHV